ncbi:hypothetical protein [Streptomyces gilvosporeus]|nr:hypothetical protein [Streptomyces gilvosporeus]
MADYVPSPEEVAAAQTPTGGWSKKQLAEWGVPWPPPTGWRKHLEAKWKGEDVGPPAPGPTQSPATRHPVLLLGQAADVSGEHVGRSKAMVSSNFW